MMTKEAVVINVVTIGGGSGHEKGLKALKRLPGIKITAIVGPTDTGGSTGKLREDYGCLGYIGDLTKCVAALCPDEFLADALLHRPSHGCLAGHPLKNILLVALEQIAKKRGCDPDQALEVLYRICNIAPHKVIPATRHFTVLGTVDRSGKVVQGEANIDCRADDPHYHSHLDEIKDTFLIPPVPAAGSALRAVRQADICIIMSGDLHTSILPPLLVGGMKQAFRESTVTTVLVMNIMTKQGETQRYTAADFVDRVERTIGTTVNRVIFDASKIPAPAALRYRGEEKVKLGGLKGHAGLSRLERYSRLIKAPLAIVTSEGKICHDPEALAEVFGKILAEIESTIQAAAL